MDLTINIEEYLENNNNKIKISPHVMNTNID